MHSFTVLKLVKNYQLLFFFGVIYNFSIILHCLRDYSIYGLRSWREKSKKIHNTAYSITLTALSRNVSVLLFFFVSTKLQP